MIVLGTIEMKMLLVYRPQHDGQQHTQTCKATKAKPFDCHWVVTPIQWLAPVCYLSWHWQILCCRTRRSCTMSHRWGCGHPKFHLDPHLLCKTWTVGICFPRSPLMSQLGGLSNVSIEFVTQGNNLHTNMHTLAHAYVCTQRETVHIVPIIGEFLYHKVCPAQHRYTMFLGIANSRLIVRMCLL